MRSAYALEVIEHDRFYLYFPSQETAIAQRLADAFVPITTFLQDKSLYIRLPLHIVLDDELDKPLPQVYMYPHREIRLPLRPPGVLEDGFAESDPWLYFLFKGLCMQSIYNERSGVPGIAHKIFGEVISPNLILPDWIIDGISNLLYEEYMGRSTVAPLDESILALGAFPELDKVSNHPEIWPGRFSYRIYGRPFIRWINKGYGWQRILDFIRIHGKGIIPIEIDIKAHQAFGRNWNQLWSAFKNSYPDIRPKEQGTPLQGYWAEPFVYWNAAGVYPGLMQSGERGRYGYLDQYQRLWLSEYDNQGKSCLKRYRGDKVQTVTQKHIWDPGAGLVAVTRKGRYPFLLIATDFFNDVTDDDLNQRLIVGPPEVMQLSGPVMDEQGRIAVAGNRHGNWDIWLYDGAWHQITSAPSVEMDPWLQDDKLIFASNTTGRFQIHDADMQPLTKAATAALMPRGATHIQLGFNGWYPQHLALAKDRPLNVLPDPPPLENPPAEPQLADVQSYSAVKSITPNYIMPDLFVDDQSWQFGVSTWAQDVSKNYEWGAGLRYSTVNEKISWRLNGSANQWNARVTSYPFSYATERLISVSEDRHEIKLAWSPLQLKALEFSGNWRRYTSTDNHDDVEQEWWTTLKWQETVGNLTLSANADLFIENSQSIYGEVIYWFGKRISTVMRLQTGKTWGDLDYGHNTFRIGGNTGEGFFTKRTTRLFPIRGFKNNILDAGHATSSSMEIFWPLAELQSGYKTLPLFLHNIRVGTFIDAGYAADDPSTEDLLISAGLELITGMEVAWGFMADFRMGVAWPLQQPDDLNEDGPIFLIQIGRPL